MTERTRRTVLAGLGTALAGGVAGCNALEDGEGEPVRFEPSEIETVLVEPVPAVERPTPVRPSAAAVEAGFDRCGDLLSSVPASLTAADVPNGVVRTKVEDARDRAVEYRDDAETAADRFQALDSLRRAREYAREAAATLAVVDEDPVPTLEAERSDLRTALGTRLSEVSYEGTDPSRTLLLAVRVEEYLTDARRRTRRGLRANPNAIDVGEFAADVELAGATLDAVDALTAAQRARTGDPRDFRDRFETAIETSRSALDDVPDRETSAADLVGDAAERVSVTYLLDEALRAVRDAAERLPAAAEDDRLALALDHAVALERDRQALDATVARIDDGEFPELTSIDQVRTEREAALAAAEAVPVPASDPSLAGDVFVRTLRRLRWTDRNLRRDVDRGRESPLRREYGVYAYHRARLEALPDAIATVRDRLDD